MSRSELTHQQIIDVVSANQGANSRKIADALHIITPETRKPFLLRLNYLVGKGMLRVKKESGTNYYYSNTPTAIANTASAAINSAATPDADLTAAASAIAEMMIRVIEGPLRAKVEQTVQAIIKDATKNFQAQVMAAIGNVPAISIPINLMPSVQPQPQPATAFIPTVEAKPAAPKLVPKLSLQPELAEIMRSVVPKNAPEPQPAQKPAKWTPNLTPKQAPAPATIAPIATKSIASSERMKLAVIGLKPGQAHMIKNEYGRQINLSFIESDGGHGKQLGALSKTCDYVIQMTKFTNHATSDHIAAFGGKLVLVSGGMTTLRDKITDLYVAWDDQRRAKAA